jgi:PAS domain S-box-containing protein
METAYKIEIKLTFILTLVVLSIICISGLYINIRMVNSRERSFYRHSESVLDEIFDDIYKVVGREQEYHIDDIIDVIEGFRVSAFSHVWLLDSDCNILFYSNPKFREYFYNHPRRLCNDLYIQDYNSVDRKITIPVLIDNTPPYPPKGKGQYPFLNEIYYVVYNIIPEEDWILGIAQNRTSIFADVNQVKKHILMIGVILALLIPFMSLLATGQVLKPILKRRNQLERMLNQTEQDYEKLVNNANDIIFTLDMGGKFTFINKKGIEILGYRREEILQKRLIEIIRPQNHEYVIHAFEQVLENTPIRDVRCEMIHKNGDLIQVDINMIAVASGKTVTGGMGIARDVTRRSELERMIIDAKNKLLTIFDSITDGILIVDSEFRILAVNQAEAKYLGDTPQQLIGKKCFEMYENASEICAGCVVNETFETGNKKYAHINKGEGKRKNIDVYTFPLRDPEGKTIEVIVYIKDVTRERRIQDQLIQSERLAAIGEIAASIAHEIRTPLISIGGYAKSLLKEHREEDAVRHKIQIIVEEVDKLERFLREHLDLIKPMQPIYHHYDINQLIDETLDRVRSKISTDVAFETSYYNSLPLIKVDVNRMEEALLNIVLNSIDAFDQNKRGVITIRTSLSDGYVIIDIEDNGNGISDEIRDNIFTPFFTTKPGKYGLGLPISYMIIKNHQGALILESQVDRGTHFTIKLPVA